MAGLRRLRMAAALSASIVLVWFVGAPVVPVMLGATLGYAWLVRRAVAAR